MTPSGKMHRTINKGAKEANKKYQEATKKLQQSTPNSDQAIQYIKEYCNSYLSWIPGGRQFVDSAFQDIDTLREGHGDEVNELITDAYKQLQNVSKSGLSMETASRTLDVLADLSKKLANLTGDAFADILDNHPQAKEKFGGSINQLKQMGDQYGPDAKQQVEETFKQLKEIMAGGFSAANVDKARRVVEDKLEKLKGLGDEAWSKGLEQAKPLLEKNPKVKSLVEDNADALKQGNAKELFETVKRAVESGDVGNLQDYIKKATEKAKSQGSRAASGLGLDQYFKMLPSGGDILSKVNQLKEVADKHKDEGEQLLKETMEEVNKVLEKKWEKAKEIGEKAKKDTK